MIDFVLENRWVLIPIGIAWVGVMFSIKVLIIGAIARLEPPPPLPEEDPPPDAPL